LTPWSAWLWRGRRREAPAGPYRFIIPPRPTAAGGPVTCSTSGRSSKPTRDSSARSSPRMVRRRTPCWPRRGRAVRIPDDGASIFGPCSRGTAVQSALRLLPLRGRAARLHRQHLCHDGNDVGRGDLAATFESRTSRGTGRGSAGGLDVLASQGQGAASLGPARKVRGREEPQNTLLTTGAREARAAQAACGPSRCG
jgi:hypothetical protein